MEGEHVCFFCRRASKLTSGQHMGTNVRLPLRAVRDLSGPGTVILLPIHPAEDQEVDYANLPQLLESAPMIIVCTVEGDSSDRYHLETLTQVDRRLMNLLVDHAIENPSTFHPVDWNRMSHSEKNITCGHRGQPTEQPLGQQSGQRTETEEEKDLSSPP
jgi:hypothetical protein